MTRLLTSATLASREKTFRLSINLNASSRPPLMLKARGYGKQSCGGYKITVNDFCKREDGLYFDTELFGPKSDNPDERSSYPYIVIKTEYVDLPVSFSK